MLSGSDRHARNTRIGVALAITAFAALLFLIFMWLALSFIWQHPYFTFALGAAVTAVVGYFLGRGD